MVALATLAYEILLTRIFSVTMWYHFAFLAISVAMFGMTLGAVIVYLFNGYFTAAKANSRLALSSILFAVSIIISFRLHLETIRLFDNTLDLGRPANLLTMAITFMVVSVPFIFSGISVSLALTKFPRQVSRLYAADLAGAAAGCIFLFYVIGAAGGPGSVFAIALAAALGAMFFSVSAASRKIWLLAAVGAAFIVLLGGANSYLSTRNYPLLNIDWIKGEAAGPSLHEKWNSYSYIRVTGAPEAPERPIGWGMSPTLPPETRARQLHLSIDASAATVLTAFDGNPAGLEHLKYDIVNLAHYLRPGARVLAIGSGGGRDLLSALAFNQESVLGVEYNEAILEAVNGKYGDFTGHLDRHPRVTLVNDEARSYISRQDEKFDIIQISLIDTWAATVAGAFVLAENSLYTTEAWGLFLDRLEPEGVLTMSRWYAREKPSEMYRLTSLAATSLKEAGVASPRDNIIIVKNPDYRSGLDFFTVGTMLVSKEPFPAADIDAIETAAASLGFEVVLSPRYTEDEIFARIASGEDPGRLERELPINISAPTDNSPFFFNLLGFRDAFDSGIRDEWSVGIYGRAVTILSALLIIVTALTGAFIIFPLLLTTDRAALRGSLPLFVFFMTIGLGFMMIEISQLQRLSIFLGHPTYSLAVVLFSLLLSSGIGSYTTSKINFAAGQGKAALLRLALLLATLFIFGLVTPAVIDPLQSSANSVRIITAASILFPVGLFLGMAFPLGMKLAARQAEGLTPWLWGINGATSVCASVLAVAISLSYGIAATFWAGLACYVAALLAFIRASRRYRSHG